MLEQLPSLGAREAFRLGLGDGRVGPAIVLKVGMGQGIVLPSTV